MVSQYISYLWPVAWTNQFCLCRQHCYIITLQSYLLFQLKQYCMIGLQGIPSPLVLPILFYLLLYFLSLSSSFLPIQVIARGQLLSHQSVESSGSSVVLEVTVSARHTPRFQVVCFFSQENRELVGDMIEIETDCSLEHKVAMWDWSMWEVPYTGLYWGVMY